MLRSQHLAFAYAKNAPSLAFPDVELGRGEQLLVLGPSGSGKSTLLALWAGLLTPSGGTVTVDDVEVSSLSGRARDRWRSRQVGLVFQRPRLLHTQDLRSNIALQRKLAGLQPDEDLINRSMQRLEIYPLANKLPQHCSLGEQQRAGILRALVHSPSLILADEPTSALDRSNAERVTTLLQEEAVRSGATLVVVTHDERIADLFSRKLELTGTALAA